MSDLSVLNLKSWVEENRHLFKPPVGNRYLYRGPSFFVMVVGGPNARNDFHVTESEEFFYQLEGEILVRTREDGRIVDHRLGEGDTLFIPPNLPHSPQRPPNTVGIVVERVRPPDEMEHLVFYCEDCGELVCDIEFACKDIVVHFRETMEAFWDDEARRTCKKCGTKVLKPGPMEALPAS
ncbi:MAG: 3-hydroxyanthranilate 3,4-dioxygenase [Planctomycetes bacterium]|nr:3-hydroxyanthranilate 3,4-dioxygenase [Planctomycetota bacterium]